MRTFQRMLAALLALTLAGCSDPSRPAGVHWITLQQLTSSLGDTAPMAVGFDIDDTVLFSSPCFYEGQQKYSPGSNDYLKNRAFWTETNAGCDRYSIPKDVARALIDLHQRRGDTLFFVTARPKTEGEQVTAILEQVFAIRDMQPVVFTSGPEKARFLQDRGVHLYYGDSDSDIRSAQAVGARAIRVMRAANSTNQPLPANGALGEEVLVDSTH
ncbi:MULTISPECIES: acid phosphatase AphA [unclassified Pseudomonas]|uniref:acid phosphatase AphA n=1 Tax=unclassified Pseudomonas TaxID=196821 RepID=UPI0021CAE179|nr:MULTISPECIES: acid phosphatase AphA [unclassified Pseudomonas]MCU1730266.1 acid phosphatase AphA [Pseudomonas sp. 20P_3.2_Bac4]MCU1744554.1 acid phosphatase AphA [Pseudomonas sp. 20P_3.2_Bac5]